jgi:hypothetical protein
MMSDPRPVVNDAHRFAPAAPDESLVYGACAPGWHTAVDRDTAVSQWLAVMHEHGIERVCCLLTGRRLDDESGIVDQYRSSFGDEAVTHVPVPDRRLVDAQTLRRDIIPFLDSAVADRAPVVVHCLDGLGRTGVVLAAWLVHDRGVTPHEAIETVQDTGRQPIAPTDRSTATRRDVLSLLDRLD